MKWLPLSTRVNIWYLFVFLSNRRAPIRFFCAHRDSCTWHGRMRWPHILGEDLDHEVGGMSRFGSRQRASSLLVPTWMIWMESTPLCVWMAWGCHEKCRWPIAMIVVVGSWHWWKPLLKTKKPSIGGDWIDLGFLQVFFLNLLTLLMATRKNLSGPLWTPWAVNALHTRETPLFLELGYDGGICTGNTSAESLEKAQSRICHSCTGMNAWRTRRASAGMALMIGS